MKAKIIVIVAAAAALISFSALAADSSLRAAKDDAGGLFMAGTLAPLNSFEFKAAPAYTRLASIRRTAAVALRKGSISVDRAEAIQASADKARSLLDRSVDACKQDNKTGACTGNGRQAEQLLASAQRAIAAIR